MATGETNDLAVVLPGWRPPWLHWALAGLAYGLLTLVITYPVAFNLTGQMAGEGASDTLEFVWSTWWWKHALLDLHQNPIHIGVLNHPSGLDFPLLPLLSQPFLLALPLAAVTSPVVAYNVIFLVSFVLSGLAGYALCAELSGDRRAGFVGGLVWAFFPNKMGHALAGHLFQLVAFAFPLAALGWVRLLKRPSPRSAAWAGLTLALASTVHPIYLAYFVAPLVLVLVGHALWMERRSFFTRERVRAAAIALGLAAALIGPLLVPTAAEALKGQLGYLTPEKGAVELSLDALAYLLPPPNNPFVLHTPLAGLSQRAVWREYETIATLGWVPLVLAVVGARGRRSEGRPWVWLACFAGVLALGPLLKFGGEIVRAPVEDGSSPVVLPYSFVGGLPFFRWGRSPGRLDALVMLAVSTLAAFGFQHVSRLSPSRLTRAAPLLVAASLLIVAEYLVKFPFPTVPADTPSLLRVLRGDPSNGGVIQLPRPDHDANLRALYWQTIHERPLVGGRVYRDVPGGWDEHEFLSRLLLSPDGPDIVPAPTDVQRHAALADAQVRWVLYDAQADPDGAARATLESRLGPPIVEGEGAALFDPPGAGLRPDDLLWAVGAEWNPAQDWGGEPGRWLSGRGRVYAFSPSKQVGRLAFTAIPGLDQEVHRLTLSVNGAPVGRFVVSDWAEYRSEPITLAHGLNRIEFVDEAGTRRYRGDPRCEAKKPLSGPYPVPLPCDSADRTPRELSLVISKLRLVRANAPPAITPSGAVIGEALQLVGFALPERAEPGETIAIHLVWQALAVPAEDFTVFVHLLGPDGALAAGADSQPVDGAYPTSQWNVGDVVAYNVRLAVLAGLAPGDYTVELGAYRWPSLERLVVSGAADAQDQALRLGTVRVEE